MPPFSELQYDTITASDASSSSFNIDNIAPAEPRKAPLDRHVHFATYEEVLEIPHINDLSDEEVDGVWMTEDELRSIRRRCLDMVKMMDKDEEKAIQKISCTRGLYEHTRQYIEKRNRTRGKVYVAVLSVQYHHDATGEYDAELLGEISRKYSAVSVLQAQVVALRDAVAIFEQES
jgi:hypothetical protein